MHHLPSTPADVVASDLARFCHLKASENVRLLHPKSSQTIPIMPIRPSPTVVSSHSMTSRTLSTTTVPRFNELSEIQCSLFADCLWTALLDSPELARIVQTLDFGDSDTIPRELIPKLADCAHCNGWTNYWTAHDCELRTSHVFVGALEKMINLSMFKWNATPFEWADCPQPWPVLAAYCQNLRHVEVNDYTGRIWGTELFNLSGLTYFRYVTSYQHPDTAPGMTRLETMLRNRCPQLQTLYLDFGAIHLDGCPPADIGQSVLRGYWPDLESLTLHGTMCAPKDIVTFLGAHKRLQHLDIDRTVGCGPLWQANIALNPDLDGDWDSRPFFSEALGKRLECPSGILPNLKTLACFSGQAVDILKAMFAGSRAAESVELFLKGEGEEDDNPRLEEFWSFAASHKRELSVVIQEDTWEW
ncbi:hypothetical protein FA95DRAFT_1678695 [Auriscalpium vulgare]|uniref:Uncharacterized protein n=1 Tax=Auriscalpium vulgare TaxID=40419 RepID=A0ACB8RW01_9AGAM|nr:hypothetical protein FA95DRAFT_1678695 [Auriscalpium vulgare]